METNQGINNQPIMNESAVTNPSITTMPPQQNKLAVGISLALATILAISTGVFACLYFTKPTDNCDSTTGNTQQTGNSNETPTNTAQTPNDNSPTPVESTDVTPPANKPTADEIKQYIYVPEWNIKIKLADKSIDNISYLFNGELLTIIDKAGVYLGPSESEILDNDNAELKITRSPAGEIDFENCQIGCSQYITTINGYDYSSLLSGNNVEVLANTPLQELRRAENYSEIIVIQ